MKLRLNCLLDVIGWHLQSVPLLTTSQINKILGNFFRDLVHSLFCQLNKINRPQLHFL